MKKLSYWQRIKGTVGPGAKKDFHKIGSKDTRKAFEDYIIKNKFETVLDVGCNTGVEGYRLFESGFSGLYTGVDSNEKAVKLAEKNLSDKNAKLYI